MISDVCLLFEPFFKRSSPTSRGNANLPESTRALLEGDFRVKKSGGSTAHLNFGPFKVTPIALKCWSWSFFAIEWQIFCHLNIQVFTCKYSNVFIELNGWPSIFFCLRRKYTPPYYYETRIIVRNLQHHRPAPQFFGRSFVEKKNLEEEVDLIRAYNSSSIFRVFFLQRSNWIHLQVDRIGCVPCCFLERTNDAQTKKAGRSDEVTEAFGRTYEKCHEIQRDAR